MNLRQALSLGSLVLCVLCLLSLHAKSADAQSARPAVAQRSSAQSPQKSGASKRAQLQKKVVDLKLVLEKTPDDLETILNLSRALLQLGRYQTALTYLTQADQSGEASTRRQFLLAFTLRKLKRYPEAVTAYEELLASANDEELLGGILGLAKTLELMGDPQGAIEQYQRYLSLEKRPSKRKSIEEAKDKVRRLSASEVVLIDEEADDTSSETSSQLQPSGVTSKTKGVSSAPEETEETEKTRAQGAQQAQAPQQLSAALERADQLFAKENYEGALVIYQQLTERQLPETLKVQFYYFAAVSAYLATKFKDAQQLAERGLLLKNAPSPKLEALAVLSFIRLKESETTTLDFKSTLRRIRLQLKEGRFNDCLREIDKYQSQLLSESQQKKIEIDPLVFHAQGRAFLGLGRHEEAYSVLLKAREGFSHPHLVLDLALTAQKLGRPKEAQKHLAELQQLTRPLEGQEPSPIHQLTQLGGE